MGETRREKKGRQEGICQGIESAKVSSRIPIPVLVPREAKERVRPAVQNDTVFALSTPLSLSLLSLSRFRSCSLVLSFPSLQSLVRLSPRSVREPSHSQKTQNADGHVSRRHRSAGGEGPEEEGGEQRCARVCVWVSVCVCYGARRFTDYILTVLRRFRYTDRRRWEFCYFGTAFLAMSTNRDRSVIEETVTKKETRLHK